MGKLGPNDTLHIATVFRMLGFLIFINFLLNLRDTNAEKSGASCTFQNILLNNAFNHVKFECTLLSGLGVMMGRLVVDEDEEGGVVDWSPPPAEDDRERTAGGPI